MLDENVLIPQARTKPLIVVLVATLFVSGGIWLFARASEQARYSPAALEVIGFGTVLLFSFFLVYGVWKLLDATPSLTINSRGLIDRSSGPLSAGEIPWDQIEGVKISTMQFQRFLTVRVRNPEKYLFKGNFIRQIAYQSNQKHTGSPINIPAISLKGDLTQILALIQECQEKYSGRK